MANALVQAYKWQWRDCFLLVHLVCWHRFSGRTPISASTTWQTRNL